MSNLLMLPTSS